MDLGHGPALGLNRRAWMKHFETENVALEVMWLKQ